MDVVFIVGGTALRNGGMELRYALRGVEENLYNKGRVWIFGDCPKWVSKEHITHIQVPDLFKSSHSNTCLKVHHAAYRKAVSDPFLLFNDDFYLCSPISAEGMPYIREGTLQSEAVKHGGNYRKAMWNTARALKLLHQHERRPLWSFEVHAPLPIVKSQFIAALKRVLWAQQHPSDGILWRSVYGNLVRRGSTIGKDVKIFPKMSMTEVRSLLEDAWVFSTAAAYGPELGSLLQHWFPKPSVYEKES